MRKYHGRKEIEAARKAEAELVKGYADHERRMAVEGALEWFDKAIHLYEAHLRELKQYRARFVESVAKPDQFAKPVDVLSWAVNHTQWLTANLNTSNTLRVAADLTRTEPQR